MSELLPMVGRPPKFGPMLSALRAAQQRRALGAKQQIGAAADSFGSNLNSVAECASPLRRRLNPFAADVSSADLE